MPTGSSASARASSSLQNLRRDLTGEKAGRPDWPTRFAAAERIVARLLEGKPATRRSRRSLVGAGS